MRWYNVGGTMVFDTVTVVPPALPRLNVGESIKEFQQIKTLLQTKKKRKKENTLAFDS
jgi:hypothetical protein